MPIRKLILLSALFWLVSCSTQKNTWLSRNHNAMTARYNILFNGEQSFQRGEEQLRQNHQDQFTSILPLFPYSGDDKAGAVKGDMDNAIAKGLKVIQKKSITVRPKGRPDRNNPRQVAFYNQREFNKVVGNAYILIGKAHLFNHEYYDALTALDYAFRDFPGKPVQYEALIWMARTRIEMGDFENARIVLDRYDALGDAPAKYYADYMATYADYLIRSGQYNSAIPFVAAAAEGARDKWDRSRRNYILAQLYEKACRLDNAKDAYLKVARSSPGYDMEVTARLNVMLLESKLNGNIGETVRELDRMAGQFKNQEYRDRIYMTKARLSLYGQDTLQALVNLRLAAGYNIGSRDLLAESFLNMADIYFDIPDYMASYAYYDSALINIPQTHTRLEQIKFRHKGLKNLSAHLNTIYTQDSLQRLAAMTDEELNSYLEAYVEAEKQSRLNKDISGGGSNYNTGFDPLLQRSMSSQMYGSQDGRGAWYFYNPTMVTLGKMEFERRWGRRPAEDNWRRSDKSAVAISDFSQPPALPGDPGERPQDTPGAGTIPDGALGQSDELPSVDRLKSTIPRSKEDIEASHKLKGEAYFKAALVLLDYFNLPEQAIVLLSSLLSQYPDHELAEQALFWSYRAQLAAGNVQQAQTVGSTLLLRFPDGYYAPFVRDPEYATKLYEASRELYTRYEDAYNAYRSNGFEEALSHTSYIRKGNPDPSLERKAILLSAISNGKLGQKDGFVRDLKELSGEYPESAEGKMAGKWLAMLDEGMQPAAGPVAYGDASVSVGLAGTDDPGSTAFGPLYSFEPSSTHSIFVVVDADANINRLIFNLADYNFNRFLLADYELEAHTLPNGQRLISISSFNNNREAMDYFYALRSNPRLLNVGNINRALIMTASETNLKVLLKTGNLEAYQNFFTENYLSGSGGYIIDVLYETQN